MDTVKYAMDRIGIERPTWQTLVVSATKDVDLPVEALWRTFTTLETWPTWSPLHSAVRWTGAPDWVPGATFEQTLELGFPVGRQVAQVTLGAVEPGHLASWWHLDGLRDCHIWEFAEQGPGQTRITNTEVFHGTAIGLTKPLVGRNWQRKFEGSVDGLARAAAG